MNFSHAANITRLSGIDEFGRTCVPHRPPMATSTPGVQEALVKVVLQMAELPDLTDAEVDWLYRLVLRLIAELSVRKSGEDIAA